MARFEFASSPIDFVLVAPAAQGEAVIASGGTPDMALTGFAALHAVDTEAAQELARGSAARPLWAALWPVGTRAMIQSAESVPVPNIIPGTDRRRATVQLTWRGPLLRGRFRVLLERLLSERAVEIVKAGIDRDVSQVEYLVAPIVFLLHEVATQETERQRRRKHALIAIWILYAGTGLIAAGVYFTHHFR